MSNNGLLHIRYVSAFTIADALNNTFISLQIVERVTIIAYRLHSMGCSTFRMPIDA